MRRKKVEEYPCRRKQAQGMQCWFLQRACFQVGSMTQVLVTDGRQEHSFLVLHWLRWQHAVDGASSSRSIKQVGSNKSDFLRRQRVCRRKDTEKVWGELTPSLPSAVQNVCFLPLTCSLSVVREVYLKFHFKCLIKCKTASLWLVATFDNINMFCFSMQDVMNTIFNHHKSNGFCSLFFSYHIFCSRGRVILFSLVEFVTWFLLTF